MTRALAKLGLLAAVIGGCSGSGAAGGAPPPAESVVQVYGTFCREDAQGSAVLIGQDLVLTSAHVVAGSDGGLSVRRPGAPGVAATLVAFDPDLDLALLTAPGVGGSPGRLAAADAGTEGVIGTMNADGELELLAFSVDKPVTAHSGDIYDEGEVTRSALQLSAETLPGDSGGALFDSSNHVIGVVFAQSRGTDGVAYAVASDEVEAFLAAADTSGEVLAGRCR